MKLLKLHVENFGTLRDFDLDLRDGLNILHQKNGWGKSTLAVFIKAMLYGLPATSKRSLDENERKKYTPWQGGAFGGSLDFETAKGAFRAERFFGAKESADSFALYDLSSNLPSNAYSEALGEELFGIDVDGFERSTYLSQRALASGKENNSISAKLGNLLDDVGDIGNYDTAIEALEKRRRHYVMTGNRGRIAELEQTRVEKQSELERCARVKEALLAQETELAACNLELSAVQKDVAKTRDRLKVAGLERERLAHLEQKEKMQKELAVLLEEKERNDRFFNGQAPSEDELAKMRHVYGEIRDLRVKSDTLRETSAEKTALERLQKRYPSPKTAENALGVIEEKNDALQKIRHRAQTLTETLRENRLKSRFANGAPTEEELREAHDRLERARSLQGTMDLLKAPSQKAGIRLPLAILPSILGGVVLLCSLLPALAALRLPCLLIGAVLLVSGIALTVIGATSQAKQKASASRVAEKRKDWEARKAHELQWLSKFLSRYQVSVADGDMTRALTELSLLAAQDREQETHRQALQKELLALRERSQALRTQIEAALAPYVPNLTQKEDYRTDVEQIRRDLSLLERFSAIEQKRLDNQAECEALLESKKNQLLPFLKRYDPNSRMRAGECLDRITEMLSERISLTKRLEEKTAALNAFVAEKGLDQQRSSAEEISFDALSAEERELQARIESLLHRRTMLHASIDKLSVDTDRIPELESEIASLGESIAEARANSNTIASTAKFLEEAKTALSTRYLGGMQESFCRLLATLTGKRTADALMDAAFDVRIREAGKTHEMESFSRGWRDAVQFCVRLSLTEALYEEGEKPFLLLDDPFVNLDDERLSAARLLLDELSKRYQIVYLVCHKDRV